VKPLLRILALWRPHAPELGLGLLISLATLAAGVALMVFSGTVIAAVLGGAVIATPLALRAAGIGRVVLRYLERLVGHDATFRALADLRVWFFRGLAARSAGGLGFARSGDMLSRLVGDVEALDGLYLRIALPLVGALVLIPVAGLLIGRHDVVAGIVTALLLALSAFVLPLLVARDAVRSGQNLAEAASGLRVAALDTFSGLREVRAYAAEARMTALIAAGETRLLAQQRRLAHRTAAANAAGLLLGQLALLAVLASAGMGWSAQIGAVFLVVASFEAVALMPRAGIAAGTAAGAAARVLAVADGPAALADPAKPARLPQGTGIGFEKIVFSYAPGAPGAPLFDGLSLDVPPGARVAILGPSGTGKSTLAALALKVVTPQSGRVTLGGMDIATLAAAELRGRIAYLGQTTHLFDDTIRNNVLLGRPDAGLSDIWVALNQAAVGDWVRGLPDDIDTWLGEGGARVSGGQGRRIALARALLSRAPVLILDEPCAGLDADTEREFLETLFANTAGRTVILIVHRLTGVEKLDRIWRLSAGHAVAAAA
jgi:ATP-binding cassette subfamily C protein CydC